jgi:hypothetical protein
VSIGYPIIPGAPPRPTYFIGTLGGGGGGGGGGSASAGSDGGCGGGGAGVGGGSLISGGQASAIGNFDSLFPGSVTQGFAGGVGMGGNYANSPIVAGGGGGVDMFGQAGDAFSAVAGGGGAAKTLTVLNDSLTFGGGGGGGGVRSNNVPSSGASGGGGAGAGGRGVNGGVGQANTGSGGGGGGGSWSASGGGDSALGGVGGAGGSGRVILKVTTPNTNPFSITSGSVPIQSYFDTIATYKFRGVVSSYDRTTGVIKIANIQNITGSFVGPTTYTFNVDNINGGNAGSNIEIINSIVNLSIKSDIQMNGYAIVSDNTLNLKGGTSLIDDTDGTFATKYLSITINGIAYKLPLYT